MLLLLECQCHMHLTINYTTFHHDLNLHWLITPGIWHTTSMFCITEEVYAWEKFSTAKGVTIAWPPFHCCGTIWPPRRGRENAFRQMSRSLPRYAKHAQSHSSVLWNSQKLILGRCSTLPPFCSFEAFISLFWVRNLHLLAVSREKWRQWKNQKVE